MTEEIPEPEINGYHGTTSEAARLVLAQGFKASRNLYDWLGDGVYFFQDAPQRASEWAIEHHGEDAAVVGASIRLINCLDLVDTRWTKVLPGIYDGYLRHLKAAGLSRPKQTGGFHRLDREVINYTVGVLAERGVTICCVRAAFAEGHPVYPDSALFDRAHIQIAVRDVDSCIQRIWVEPVQ